MQKNSINHITKVLVDVIFVVGILSVLAVPLLSRYIAYFYGYGSEATVLFSIFLFVSGVFAVYIVFNLKQMFKTLLGGNPFVEKNMVCFRRMAVACFIISAIFVVKCFVLFTPGTVIVAAVFIVLGLFCLTLKNIFAQAIAYKQENDLTV